VTNVSRGPHYVAIYNEAYKHLAASTHPQLMGGTFEGVFPEQWPIFKPYFERARETGTGQNYDTPAPLVVDRYGFREEYDCSDPASPCATTD
jgi:hypothetical protein